MNRNINKCLAVNTPIGCCTRTVNINKYRFAINNQYYSDKSLSLRSKKY